MAQPTKTYQVTYNIKRKPRPVISEIIQASSPAGARVAVRYDNHRKGQGVVFHSVVEVEDTAA